MICHLYQTPSFISLLPVLYLKVNVPFVFPQRTVQVPLPDSATVDPGSSSCGTDGSSLPWLVAVFGSGHALGLSFTTNGSLYSVANLTLQYNLSDSSTFPEANSSGENRRMQLVVKCVKKICFFQAQKNVHDEANPIDTVVFKVICCFLC